jgi:hypothetical protein
MSVVKITKVFYSKTPFGQTSPLMARRREDFSAFVGALSSWLKKSTMSTKADAAIVAAAGTANQVIPTSGRASSARFTHRAAGAASLTKTGTTGADTDNSSVKDFLSTCCVEWLNPCSSLPSSADEMTSMQQGSIGKEFEIPALEMISPDSNMVSESQLLSINTHTNQFIGRYTNQHSASLFNSRLYICLEERSSSMISLRHALEQQNAKSLSPGGNGSDLYRDEEFALNLISMLQVQLLSTQT